jgi:hypothetical protein
MKTTLIRTLAIAMLATSISVFAQTSDTNRADQATTSTTTQQNGSNQKVNGQMEFNVSQKLGQEPTEINRLENNHQVNQEEEKKEIQREDTRWSKSLMGIYG